MESPARTLGEILEARTLNMNLKHHKGYKEHMGCKAHEGHKFIYSLLLHWQWVVRSHKARMGACRLHKGRTPGNKRTWTSGWVGWDEPNCEQTQPCVSVPSAWPQEGPQ